MAPDAELMTGLGAAASMFLTALGSALASVQAGKFAMRSTGGGVLSFAPIMSSGVLAIYGIIVSVLLGGKIGEVDQAGGYKNFAAGISVGLTCLASGLGMAGFIEDSLHPMDGRTITQGLNSSSEATEPLVRNNNTAPRPYPTSRFLMCMIFLEAIGFYGLIVALVLIGK